MAQVIRTKPYAEWASLFDAADVPFAQARLTEESLDDPQVAANRMVVELQDPEVGPIVQMGVPIELSATPGKVQGPRVLPTHSQAVCLTISRHPTSVCRQSSQTGLFDPPLKGIRVLEITNLIAGPTAGRLLADLGADVIKFEPLDGDMSRPIGRTYFFNLNAHKRSMSVNTRTPEGKEVAQKVAATADVLLANMRPGATERMGIGPEVLKTLNPRIIETHVTGYGWRGPYAHRPGIDPLAQALMGLQRAQGGPENPRSFRRNWHRPILPPVLWEPWGRFSRCSSESAQAWCSALIPICSMVASSSARSGSPATLVNQTRRLADKGQYGLDAFHRLYQAHDGWIYVVAETHAERSPSAESSTVRREP